MGKGKIVYVDFRKGKKPTSGGFGGGPRLLFGVFLLVLFLELLGAALLYPSAIGSFFFGPTVIAVAVVATLAVRRLIARVQVGQLYRRTLGTGVPRDRDDDHTSRTLH